MSHCTKRYRSEEISPEGCDLKCALLDFDKVPDLAGKSQHVAVAEGEAEDLRSLLNLNHLLPGVGP